ncbi:MAG: CYTH domain-containing protein [Clostridia bacterium]
MIEREKKILLTQKEYAALLKHFFENACRTYQTNHYYDTEDYALHRSGVTCRIREKDGKFQATKKSHLPDSDSSEELSAAVSSVTDSFPFGDVRAAYKGFLVTERAELHSDGVDFYLDKNNYLGMVDFELEIEYLPGRENEANKLLQDVASFLMRIGFLENWNQMIHRIGKGGSKSGRFFERLQKYNRLFWGMP